MSNPGTSSKGMGFIIGASSVGTLIEWYDFYIFGMLATIISKQFFPEYGHLERWYLGGWAI
jgi:hypothetical protein